MRTIFRKAAVAALAVAVLVHAPMVLAAEKTPEAAPTAQDLVREALLAELDGAHQRRGELLNQALALEPGFAPARWHSGYVRFGGKWLKIDDVPRYLAGDEQLAAYRKQREALIDTADSHRQLARWCHKRRLLDEARVHWVKVLQFDPLDAEAQGALGLQLHNGRLLTRKQIDQLKQAQRERAKALRAWQPQVAKWRRAIERGGTQREAALEELRQLDDLAALPALAVAFAIEGDHEKAIELNRALIETVGRSAGPDATDILVRRALVSDSDQVRSLVAAELKKRPPHSFVPKLLASVPEIPDTDVRTSFQIFAASNGMTIHTHLIELQEGQRVRLVAYNHVLDQDLYTYHLDYNPNAPSMMRRAASIEAQAREAQAVSDRRKLAAKAQAERIRDVIEEASSLTLGDDTQTWWDAYYDYQELYTSPSWSESQAPNHTEYVSMTYLETRYWIPPPPPSYSCCFPAGTVIQTASGLIPIENVHTGDRVLSQDALTGELAFNTAQGVTLRPAAPLVAIRAGSETIRSTRGHPFWVNGQGWRMAKQLSAGDVLHGWDGGVTIESVSEEHAVEAYNLVVGDFGTYFVGESGLLVHDNSPIAETVTLVPGLPVREAVAQR